MNQQDIDRFWQYVDSSGECWLWIGGGGTGNGRNPRDTYGRFHLGDRSWRAHRVSWLIHFGEIPRGVLVCHSCDNPRCVRPEHLFLGSVQDNSQDALNKGRLVFPAPATLRRGERYWTEARKKKHPLLGERHPSAKLTESDVRTIRAVAGAEPRSVTAKRFGVGWRTVYDIQVGRKWKHVV